jgi:RNA polymerase sigma-70 factor, ECF subfamily
LEDEPSIRLVARYKDGDQQAAGELFERYISRLIGLARSRLSPKLARRIDPEDVVQSAYRSFFSRAKDGHVELKESGDLWRLLAAITINKLRHQVDRHTAGKRAVEGEDSICVGQSGMRVAPESLAREPSPEEVASFSEELASLMSGLDEVQGQMLELRLEGHTFEEIAEQTKRSERTVRRLFDRLRTHLQARLE